MGDRIRKWIAVLLAGSILAMIQLVPAGGAVFVRENIENKEILGAFSHWNREIPMTGSRYQRKRPPCRMSSSICGRGSGIAYRIYSIP